MKKGAGTAELVRFRRTLLRIQRAAQRATDQLYELARVLSDKLSETESGS